MAHPVLGALAGSRRRTPDIIVVSLLLVETGVTLLAETEDRLLLEAGNG